MAMEDKATEQLESIKELKHGLASFEKNLAASRAEEKAMLANLATINNSIQETTAAGHNLTVMQIRDESQQSRQIVRKLEDVKSSVNLLGQLYQEQQHRALEPASPDCRSIQKYSPPESCQVAIEEAIGHICQLFYLIGVGMHALIRRIVLLYPSLKIFLQICCATIARGPTRLLEENIHFTDALGRSISLDHAIFKSWPVRKTLHIPSSL